MHFCFENGSRRAVKIACVFLFQQPLPWRARITVGCSQWICHRADRGALRLTWAALLSMLLKELDRIYLDNPRNQVDFKIYHHRMYHTYVVL